MTAAKNCISVKKEIPFFPGPSFSQDISGLDTSARYENQFTSKALQYSQGRHIAAMFEDQVNSLCLSSTLYFLCVNAWGTISNCINPHSTFLLMDSPYWYLEFPAFLLPSKIGQAMHSLKLAGTCLLDPVVQSLFFSFAPFPAWSLRALPFVP